MNAELPSFKNGEHNSESVSTFARDITPFILIWFGSDIKEGTNNWAWESLNWVIRARAGYSYERSVRIAVI